ncbi:uncharacterized protein PHACADRAFT_202750 [Phanerochaete carnosa HHB-10118-sp]|uniref:Aminoacyl-transfer RNA synthetases class-II family profile domain-containing protein n=1 Tax=Phanerochaete carnosa (strain HHB-10118-sp) TaxID=650164 RepID=K5VBL0_PHACS|nr:uncharacterized protein PHACADRAFT_202750 [Phanerochaete carnosa HHB-10118-sp]EKM48488.1 hypothetical protein PHACADRAFT_202750 [Phanerochaete carnosa HHB-10118-sp]
MVLNLNARSNPERRPRAASYPQYLCISTTRARRCILGFLEAETPIIAGDATAKPFVAHHNVPGLNLDLRIAPELHPKQLVFGSLGRAHEIGRVFRNNEGIDLAHNPEFSVFEFCMTHADMYDTIDIAECLIEGIVKYFTVRKPTLGSARTSMSWAQSGHGRDTT